MKHVVQLSRVKKILYQAKNCRVLVVGDVMLDHYIWGDVTRISPEAPVPVVRFERETYMPGGAANVARNLAALGVNTVLAGIIGRDASGSRLRSLLEEEGISCEGLIASRSRPTSIKTRIIARQQQVVRLDREVDDDLDLTLGSKLWAKIRPLIDSVNAIIICDYAKGVVTNDLLSSIKSIAREKKIWLSLDPKPVHQVDYTGFSLITPNRKEALELAGIFDIGPRTPPEKDQKLRKVAETILDRYAPDILLITLGEYGMMLCRRGENPVHIPAVAREVYDVSGAGDTVIATFTAAIIGGASPLEAAIISNQAAGIVVGKIGTATASAKEIIQGFQSL